MCKPTCTQCVHFQPQWGGDVCLAPVPMWVEMQGQSTYVKPHDDASDCPSFVDSEAAP